MTGQSGPVTDTALRADGEIIYEDNCRSCHGTGASGGNSPDIRGFRRAEIVPAQDGIEEMPEIDLTDAEIDAVAAYLRALRTT